MTKRLGIESDREKNSSFPEGDFIPKSQLAEYQNNWVDNRIYPINSTRQMKQYQGRYHNNQWFCVMKVDMLAFLNAIKNIWAFSWVINIPLDYFITHLFDDISTIFFRSDSK